MSDFEDRAEFDRVAEVDRSAELKKRWLEYAKRCGEFALRGVGVAAGVGLIVFGAAEAAWAIVDQVGLILTGGAIPNQEWTQGLSDAIRDGLSPAWAGPVGDVVGSAVGGLVEASGTPHNWLVGQNETLVGAVATNYIAGAIGAAVAGEVGPIVIEVSTDA